MISGFLLVNKPSGPTSHDVINQLRKILNTKKIGHAGTLDPFASGLLLVAIRDATKSLRHYVGLDKEYVATLRLGATSDTYDRTGVITNNQFPITKQIPISKIQKILKSFVGKQKQTPPMYSAKKVGGKKLYELAREGKVVEREAVDIEIYNIKLKSIVIRRGGQLSIVVSVSSGTYIRTLAHDIGQALGCGAYLEELERTRIGEFRLTDAISLRHADPPIRRAISSNAPSAAIRHPERSETCTRVSAVDLPAVATALQAGGSRHKAHLASQRDPSTAARVRAFAQDDVLTSTNYRQHIIPLKTVLVSGTFDGVHEGHKNYFKQARAFGQCLICIVGRGTVVERIKGKQPHYSDKERIKMVKECEAIDKVFLGIDDTDENVFDFVASLKPDIIALGYDQKAYTKNLKSEMEKRGLEVVVKKLKAFEPERYKSSKMVKK